MWRTHIHNNNNKTKNNKKKARAHVHIHAHSFFFFPLTVFFFWFWSIENVSSSRLHFWFQSSVFLFFCLRAIAEETGKKKKRRRRTVPLFNIGTLSLSDPSFFPYFFCMHRPFRGVLLVSTSTLFSLFCFCFPHASLCVECAWQPAGHRCCSCGGTAYAACSSAFATLPGAASRERLLLLLSRREQQQHK